MDRTKFDLIRPGQSESILYQQLVPMRQAHCVQLGTNKPESASRSVSIPLRKGGCFLKEHCASSKTCNPRRGGRTAVWSCMISLNFRLKGFHCFHIVYKNNGPRFTNICCGYGINNLLIAYLLLYFFQKSISRLLVHIWFIDCSLTLCIVANFELNIH